MKPQSADLNLQSALAEIGEVLTRRKLAGAVGLISQTEVGFIYQLHAPWSAIKPAPDAPLGIRIRATPFEEGGDDEMRELLGGAVHTLANLQDFGQRTVIWMSQLLDIMRDAGVEWHHVPHQGEAVVPIGAVHLADEED